MPMGETTTATNAYHRRERVETWGMKENGQKEELTFLVCEHCREQGVASLADGVRGGLSGWWRSAQIVQAIIVGSKVCSEARCPQATPNSLFLTKQEITVQVGQGEVNLLVGAVRLVRGLSSHHQLRPPP